MLRIAICDDDRSDRERICGFVSEYLKGKEIRAEVVDRYMDYRLE